MDASIASAKAMEASTAFDEASMEDFTEAIEASVEASVEDSVTAFMEDMESSMEKKSGSLK